MIGRVNPPAAPTLAKLCRKSCSRTSVSPAAHALPGILDGRAPALGPHAGDDPRVVHHAREFLEQGAGRRAQKHDLSPTLAVGQPQAFVLEIDVIHRRLAISPRRHPVNSNSFIAADG